MAWICNLFIILLFSSNLVHATIKVGYTLFDPPFVISQGEGFDIELIHMICARLAEGCEYLPAEQSVVIADLSAGKTDIAIGGFTISTNGGSIFVYSTPYKISSGQFITLTGSPIKSIAELIDNKVGCITDTTYEDYLANEYTNQFKLVPYRNMVQMINALVNGDVKALFLDETVTDYWIAHNSGQFSKLGKPMITGSGYAILAMPKNLDLIKRINSILNLLEKDGEYSKIYDAYF